MERVKKMNFILNNIDILNKGTKLTILDIIISSDGMQSIKEYKNKKCISVDLVQLSDPTICKIFDIIKKRKNNISIKCIGQ